jgi:hypothetical protein
MEDLVGHKLLRWLFKQSRFPHISRALGDSSLQLTRWAIRSTMNDVLGHLIKKIGSGDTIELGYYRVECPRDRNCAIVKRSSRRIPRKRMSLARWVDWDVEEIAGERVEPRYTNKLYKNSLSHVYAHRRASHKALERNLDLMYRQLISLIVTQCLFAPQEPLAFKDRPLPVQDTHCRVGDIRMTYDSLAEEWRVWIQ